MVTHPSATRPGIDQDQKEKESDQTLVKECFLLFVVCVFMSLGYCNLSYLHVQVYRGVLQKDYMDWKTYQERLTRLNILSLELRRLHADLILTYKILFGHVDIDVNLFDFCSTSTWGHPFKLFKHHTNHCTRSSFFCERIINVWNSLPSTVNFSSLNCFKQSIGSVDFSVFLKCS